MDEKYAVLGIQNAEDLDNRSMVARTRYFIGDAVIDEDTWLPVLPPGVPPTEAVYESLLQTAFEARVAELEANNE